MFIKHECWFLVMFIHYVLMIKSYIRGITYLPITWNLLKYIWFVSQIIILSGDKETNPGPKHRVKV